MNLLFGKRIEAFLTAYLKSKKAKDIINGAIKEYIEEWKSRFPDDIPIIADFEKRISTKKHKQLPAVMEALKHSNVLLVGPPGTGKTTIARDIAAAWKKTFYYTGGVQSEYKLMGFKDARGEYQPTPFYRAYKDGGVFLFDEIDSSTAQVLVAFNTALDNGIADFPDGDQLTTRSDKFFCLAAANTYGRGNEMVFHGRQPLDPTTLDRFTVIKIEYDPDLEIAQSVDADWTRRVQRLREAASIEVPDHFISMRASIVGGKLRKLGCYRDEDIEEMVIWRGLSPEKVSKIKMRLNAVELGRKR